MPPSRSDEARFIAWLRVRFPRRAGVETGIGDDAAVVSGAGARWVVTTDMILEGTHFDLAREPIGWVGEKALNVNVSDVAAMGCVPRFAVAAIGLRRGLGVKAAKALVAGIARAARASRVELVGGDTNSHAGGLVVAITLLGVAPRGTRPILRSGARPGDAVCVTGTLGGSILGKHLRFAPRVAAALALRRAACVHAMIDLSDGLSTDLGHVLEESGVGARIEADRLPVSAAARKLARRSGRSSLDHALHDGEDFELLFTVPQREARHVDGRSFGGVRVTRIGTITREPGAWIEGPQGAKARLLPHGYQHRM